MRLLLLFSLLLVGCSKQPTEIDIGKDACTRCMMIIADVRFASEIVSETGKVFKFDSIECMTAQKANISNIHSIWVKNFNDPTGWLDARNANFLKSKTLPSPMGGFLSAYALPSQAQDAQARYGGELANWTQLTDQKMTGPDE